VPQPPSLVSSTSRWPTTVAAVAMPWGSLPTSHWFWFWLAPTDTNAVAYWVRMLAGSK
jgi:hypothetical protein